MLGGSGTCLELVRENDPGLMSDDTRYVTDLQQSGFKEIRAEYTAWGPDGELACYDPQTGEIVVTRVESGSPNIRVPLSAGEAVTLISLRYENGEYVFTLLDHASQRFSRYRLEPVWDAASSTP